MIRWVALGLAFVSISCTEAGSGTSSGSSSATTISTNLDNLPMTERTGWKIETFVSGLEVPWAVAFEPNGNMLVTERPGRVRVVEKGVLRSEPLLTLSDLAASSESGLMGMCLHPNYAKNKFVYLAYSYRDSGGQFVKIVRYRNDGTRLTQDKIIIGGIPAAPNHAGTRVVFGPDSKLYVTTGDATDWHRAQNMNSLNGKTLRLNDDGTIPKDNPFVGKGDTRPEIWSYGHRNSQGICWQPGTGQMFQTEHGPSGFEGLGGGQCELNAVDSGKNYGWPEIHGTMSRTRMESPLVEYSPASAPGSCMIYAGKALPMFTGNLFFGALRGSSLVRVVLKGREVVKQERIVADLGRIREAAEGPDGFIYFSTSNRDGRGRTQSGDDRIMRIVPDK